MGIDLVTELLAAHADQLNRNDAIANDSVLAAFPQDREELAALMQVAARVKQTLKPVTPAPAFRARLHDGLMLAAHHQQAQRIYIDKRGEPQWGWLLGAAAAAGIIAVVWRSRTQPHPVPVAEAELPPRAE
jgi:hypothetical protein